MQLREKRVSMKKVVDIAHDILRQYGLHGTVADFTLGAGHDCAMLMGESNVEKVYAFDVQEKAIQDAKQFLYDQKGYKKVTFILAGHEHAKEYIKEPLSAGIFNFGFYPKGDHQITTIVDTSKQAVQDALELLTIGGILVLVLYPGHAQGKMESQYFDQWIKTLPSKYYDCACIQMSNKALCPYIQIIEKKR